MHTLNDITKYVSREEFDRKRKESLTINNCPICGNKVRLIIEKPFYGPNNILFQCENCGQSLKGNIPIEYYACGESNGTFITPNCIGKAILYLANSWNAHARELRNKKANTFQRYKSGI